MNRLLICISLCLMYTAFSLGMDETKKKEPENAIVHNNLTIIIQGTPPTTPKTPKSLPTTPKEWANTLLTRKCFIKTLYDDADHPLKSPTKNASPTFEIQSDETHE